MSAIYFPLEMPMALESARSDLLSLAYRTDTFAADFSIPSDGSNVLRIRFGRQHIFRVLDEMPLSTEEPTRIGIIPNHLAYRIENALFWHSQSAAFRAIWPNARHYRFVTGGTCLDVIADDLPTISVCHLS